LSGFVHYRQIYYTLDFDLGGRTGMCPKLLLFFILCSLTLSVVGCGGGGNSPENTVRNNNSNAVKANTTNPLEVATPTPEQTTNNAPTLTPVFKAFCDAWVRSDEAALRKVYSSDTIKSFELEMKAEKAKSLIKFLEDTDRVSGTPCDVTNEKITGDMAVGKIRSNRYPNGIDVVFVKENGEWKLTNRSPVLDSVKKSTNGAAK
jgi:hypothetical protein